MNKDSRSDEKHLEILQKQIRDLENRVSRLEDQKVSGQAINNKQTNDPVAGEDQFESISFAEGLGNEAIESRIGEYGMAWLGNFVLLFGIIFLIQLFDNQGLKLISTFFAFAAVAAVYLVGFGLRKHYPIMSNLFIYNGHFLLFFAALRLHFIASNPLITNKSLGLSVIFIILILLTYLAYRKKSQILAVIVLVMTVVVAIFSNATHVMLPSMLALSILSLFFTIRFDWWTVLIVSIFLVYATYLIWLLNNPFITHTLEAVSAHQSTQYYLFGFAFIYSMIALFRAKGKTSSRMVNTSIIINGLGFSLTTALVILTFFKEDYSLILGLISAFALSYSFILRWRGDWKLASALYALYGFVSLSISISIIYKFPNAFLLLSAQSLVVLSMALWFRSKFIVIMNAILLISLLIAYLVIGEPVNSINFTFAAVALITARILNWKKERLEIHTELLRNIYLITGFAMTLISLSQALPDKYITLSWTLTAVMFFILSIALKNIKYRWMAIAAMVTTAFHLFIFDLKHIGIGYRIIALMFLAVISIGISIYYSRRMKIKKSETFQEQDFDQENK